MNVPSRKRNAIIVARKAILEKFVVANARIQEYFANARIQE